MKGSPWVESLAPLSFPSLRGVVEADVAIVGGGISGITAAYELHRATRLSCCLLEADQVLFGATGNNAGHVTPYFEGGMVQFFKNKEKAARHTLSKINEEWNDLDALLASFGATHLLHPVKNYFGIKTTSSFNHYLLELQLRKELGLPISPLVINSTYSELVPSYLYREEFAVSKPAHVISRLLHTRGVYAAAYPVPVSILNVAKFCEKVLLSLVGEQRKKLCVFEHTHVNTIKKSGARFLVETAKGRLVVKHVILCTNGYTNFKILGRTSEMVQKIRSVSGVMNGYLSENTTNYGSSSFEDNTKNYFYQTLVPGEKYIGKDLNVSQNTEATDEELDAFASSTFAPAQSVSLCRRWSGVQAYTPNKLRIVAEDRFMKNLYYNLGCNGIGILPALYSAKKLRRLLLKKPTPLCLFDL